MIVALGQSPVGPDTLLGSFMTQPPSSIDHILLPIPQIARQKPMGLLSHSIIFQLCLENWWSTMSNTFLRSMETPSATFLLPQAA